MSSSPTPAESANLIELLQKEYGIAASITALPGELDWNFLVQAATERYVLKVMRADCERRFIEMQIGAMQRARNGLADAIPAVVPNQAGDTITHTTDGEGQERICWLVAFVEGCLMADCQPWSPAMSESLGSTLAKLDHSLAGYQHPMLNRPSKWNLLQAGWVADELSAIESTKRRELVAGISTRFETQILPQLQQLPQDAIHGDANDMNIMFGISPTQRHEVTGIFDFGDMSQGPRVCEVAVALAYAMMGPGDPLARAAALVSGYHQHTPLTSQELSLLYPLVQSRLSVTVTNSAIQRRANPENEYLTISEAPAWQLLEYLEAIEQELFDSEVRSACDTDSPASTVANRSSLIARRQLVSPCNQKLSYTDPVRFVRGRGHFLYDADGTEYLDVYNNVPHVGHAHPHVVAAASEQLATLNTNTRYLQDVHLDYAERMLSLLPAPLNKIVFLSSASEANELALRLSRAATGARDMIVMDHGYHGATTGAMDISPYKFHHPRGAGSAPSWVHVATQPDCYRGLYRDHGAADAYLDDFRSLLLRLDSENVKIAGFISECLPSVGGQIVLPDGYLQAVYAMVRQAGGVCIADDVQTGLGRLGDYFWGHQQQHALPDIAVMGKPLGNGFPLAAVAMTDEIAAAFSQGPEFFSTFGGSTAACAAGAAVLDVLRDENLPENARLVGGRIKQSLKDMATNCEIIGDVRGYGLFLGVDLVTDRHNRLPATAAADRIKNQLREQHILIGVEGPDDNVLKIRPPMSFDMQAADRLLSAIEPLLRDGA